MAECIFIGGAPAVAQVDTLTPGGVIEADDIFNVTLENNAGEKHTLSVAAGGAAAADVVDAIVAEAAVLKAAGTDPWDEVTVADGGNTATITADTAGVPFWATETTTEAGGGAQDAQTFAVATTTTGAGPGIYDTAENWQGQAVPVAGDSVVIERSVTGIIYGSDQSAVTLLGFIIESGSALSIGGKGQTLHINLEHTGTNYNADLSGTGTIYLEVDDYDTIIVRAAGAGTTAVPWALNLTGALVDTNPPGLISILSDKNTAIGIGANAGETMEAEKVLVHKGATVEIGDGVTDWDSAGIPIVEMSAGDVTCRSAVVTATLTGGNLYLEDAVAMTTGNMYGGVLYYKSTGTLTTANVGDGGTLDFTKDLRTRTVTTCNRYGAGKIKDPHKTTGSIAVICQQGGNDANLDLGNSITLTRS